MSSQIRKENIQVVDRSSLRLECWGESLVLRCCVCAVIVFQWRKKKFLALSEEDNENLSEECRR